MCIRVCRYRTVKSLENQRIVIPVADHAGNNAADAEVQNCAEIDFACLVQPRLLYLMVDLMLLARQIRRIRLSFT